MFKVPAHLKLFDSKEVFALPEVAALAQRLESDALAKRKALVAELATENNGKNAAKGSALARSFDDADVAVTAARASLDRALAAKEEARRNWYRASDRGQLQRHSLEGQLRETADFRFGLYILALDDLWERARHETFIRLEVESGPSESEARAAAAKRYEEASFADKARARVNGWLDLGPDASPPKGAKRILCNVSNVEENLRLLRETQDATRAAQLEALTRDEVLARLTTFNETLRQPLSTLGLEPPAIVDGCPQVIAA